jgi:uncharacterized protein involved in outer membrane biogenesis
LSARINCAFSSRTAKGIPVRAPVKLLLWLIAAMSTLVAVLLALLLFIDVDVYRGQIQRHVSTAFGRDIVLEGSLSLEPSLTPRLVVNGLKIANPDWASCLVRHQCVEKVPDRPYTKLLLSSMK